MKVKRKAIKNSFGEDLYVPGIPSVDLEFSTPDIGLVDFEDSDEDYNIFDYDRTDNNSDCRYIRPRPARMPSACVRFDNADALARELVVDDGMRADVFVTGSFIFGDFIEAFLCRNNIRATEITISTLSISEENIDSLRMLMDKGFIDHLRIMVSDYFYSHERRTIVPYLYKQLDIEDRFDLGVARVHTKTCHILSSDGAKFVMHGSANLRANCNIEQFTIEEDKKLYDFYEDTFNLLFKEFNTINHKVSSRDSWSDMENRLLGSEEKKGD